MDTWFLCKIGILKTVFEDKKVEELLNPSKSQKPYLNMTAVLRTAALGSKNDVYFQISMLMVMCKTCIMQ